MSDAANLLATTGILLDIAGVLLIFFRAYSRVQGADTQMAYVSQGGAVSGQATGAWQLFNNNQFATLAFSHFLPAEHTENVNWVAVALKLVAALMMLVLLSPLLLLFAVCYAIWLVLKLAFYPIRLLLKCVDAVLVKVNIDPSFFYEALGVFCLVLGFTMQLMGIWWHEISYYIAA